VLILHSRLLLAYVFYNRFSIQLATFATRLISGWPLYMLLRVYSNLPFFDPAIEAIEWNIYSTIYSLTLRGKSFKTSNSRTTSP